MLLRLIAQVYIILFFVLGASAQDNNKLDSIFVKNINLINQDIEQATKVASYLNQNPESKKQQAEGLYLSSESNFIKGNYSSSIEELYKANQIIKESDCNSLKILILTAIAAKCRLLGLDDKSNEYIQQSSDLLQSVSNEVEKNMCKALILQGQAFSRLQSNQNDEALQKLIRGQNSLKNNQYTYPVLAANIQINIAHIEKNKAKFESAKQHYKTAFSILENNHLENSIVAAKAYNGMGTIALVEKKYDLAQTLFNKAKSILLIDMYTQNEIYKNLSEAYRATGNTDQQQAYNQKYKTLTNIIAEDERQSRNVIIKEIENEQKYSSAAEKSSYNFVFAILIGILFLSLLTYYFYNRKLNREYAHFESILEKVNSNIEIKPIKEGDYSIVMKLQKGINIPDKTEKFILDGLSEFENTTFFNNPNISLQLLATKLKTNTKYLSEIIHIHKTKNFNNYINDLRINYIIKEMTKDSKYLNYKVSYLADVCGFSSHSAFSSVFKSVTELTPKQFIAFLKKKNEKEQTF